jgi:putative transposase
MAGTDALSRPTRPPYHGRVPRAPRPVEPDGIYHVVARGTRKTPIFHDNADRRLFLRLLARSVDRFGWRCFAYCLMTNHYHLAVQTPDPTISQGMHLLNGHYAQLFNERYGLEGHVFERRFWCRIVERDEQLLELARYVVLNPVRAGICAGPSDWRWSSYCATAGTARPPGFLAVGWLRGLFAADGARGAALYADFVAAGVS